MAKDPYEILGVSKDADDAQIKAAYRKLAKKHHPDLNPGNKNADATFKELNAANDLLADKEKRAAFDRGDIDMEGQPQRPAQQQHTYRDFADGPQGSRYHSDAAEFDLSDLASFFSDLGGHREGFGRPSGDIHYSIEVDFLEAAVGAKRRVTMPDGKNLDITIPEGVEEGQQLRLKGQGKKSPPGDAYVELHIRPHPLFSRKGRDISIELPIALQESILGEKIHAPTIHGPVELVIPKGANSGTTLRLKGKGIKGGDQFIKVKIILPEEIDADLEQAIRLWSEKHSYNPRKKMETSS